MVVMRLIEEADTPPPELHEQLAPSQRKQLRAPVEPIELLPHQVEAVQYLGATAGRSARLIGDEMRVGKTPTAIAIDLEARIVISRKQRGNNCTLIACPKTVMGVWEEMLRRMGIPLDQIVVADLPRKETLKQELSTIEAHKKLKDAEPIYVIVNWSTVPLLERELVRAGPWFHKIGDEIHEIKEPEGRKAKSWKRIKEKQKTALSGTWVDDKAQDAYSTLNWLWPSVYSSFWAFAREYLTTSVNRKTGFEYVDGVNFPALKRLHARLDGFYVRRTLADVADRLPKVSRQTVTVEMGARQRKEYDKMWKHAMVDIEIDSGGYITMLTPSIVEQLTRAQQMAIGVCKFNEIDYPRVTDSPKSPKINFVEDWLKENAEESLVVFANHTASVACVAERLRDAGIETVCVTGADSADDRTASIRAFQSGEARVLVGTIRSCRQGIDLSRSDTLFFLDKDWNPSVNQQCEFRIQNVQKSRPVHVYYIESKDSVDQYKSDRVAEKAAGVSAVMGRTRR